MSEVNTIGDLSFQIPKLCLKDHGVGSSDHIQKSVIFIMIHYLFHLHFHFVLHVLKNDRENRPRDP